MRALILSFFCSGESLYIDHCKNSPAVDNNRFISCLLLFPNDLTNQVYQSSSSLGDTFLWPGQELKMVDNL